MRDNLEEYIKNAHTRMTDAQCEHVIFSDVQVYINNDLPTNIDIYYVLKKIERTIPEHFSYGLNSIEIGHNDEFERRNINAFYDNGTIHVTNSQDNNDDLIDDIVHEIAHSAEEIYYKNIYGDDKIKNEFLGKRRRLHSLLKQEGFDIGIENYENVQYSRTFDEFLYKNVGYKLLTNITVGLFASPYAITSIREYFANGVEEFYIKDKKDKKSLKNTSPALYNKILKLHSLQ
tara:strand:+ start:213 stop:908 length:696 start_codon:yes stop_codon:yes gene_type:complete